MGDGYLDEQSQQDQSPDFDRLASRQPFSSPRNVADPSLANLWYWLKSGVSDFLCTLFPWGINPIWKKRQQEYQATLALIEKHKKIIAEDNARDAEIEQAWAKQKALYDARKLAGIKTTGLPHDAWLYSDRYEQPETEADEGQLTDETTNQMLDRAEDFTDFPSFDRNSH